MLFVLSEGLEVNQRFIANVVNRDGADYLDIQDVHIDISLQKLSMQFKDTLTDNIIAQSVNHVMNENWREIFQELKPDFEKNIAGTLKQILKPFFDAIPYQSLFLE